MEDEMTKFIELISGGYINADQVARMSQAGNNTKIIDKKGSEWVAKGWIGGIVADASEQFIPALTGWRVVDYTSLRECTEDEIEESCDIIVAWAVSRGMGVTPITLDDTKAGRYLVIAPDGSITDPMDRIYSNLAEAWRSIQAGDNPT
jgi:hypothetical protein